VPDALVWNCDAPSFVPHCEYLNIGAPRPANISPEARRETEREREREREREHQSPFLSNVVSLCQQPLLDVHCGSLRAPCEQDGYVDGQSGASVTEVVSAHQTTHSPHTASLSSSCDVWWSLTSNYPFSKISPSNCTLSWWIHSRCTSNQWWSQLFEP